MVCHNRPMTKALALALAAALLLAGCRSRDVRTDLEIVDVRTGWQDLGTVDGDKIKIIPAISFRLKNISAEEISGVQVNAVFREVEKDAIIDEHFVRAIPSERALAAGATSEPIVLRSRFGYTGTEPRPRLLEHKQFIDNRVTILGKHGRNNWSRMGEYTIERVGMNK